MKSIFLIINLIANLNLLYSQNIYVLDMDTKKPIPFANATFTNKNLITGGDYCDETGLLKINSIHQFDNITFSCIGYKQRTINTQKIISDTITLSKEIINLNEVVISKYLKKDILTLGYNNSAKKFIVSGRKGIESVVFIENPQNSLLPIESFLFKIKRRDKFKTAVKIHFYNKNKQKFEPGEEMFAEDVICYLDENAKGTVEVNLKKYNLLLPIEGAFIGLEWLGIIDLNNNTNKGDWTDTGIEYNCTLDKPLTFIRNRFKTNEWINTEIMKIEFSQFIKSNNYPNASFGIKLIK